MMSFSHTLAALTLLGLLSACGGQAAAPTVPTTASVETPVAPAATDAPAAGATRIVKHAMGETEVPVAPKRVVTLDMGELDAALALGIKPVGAVTIFENGVFPEYMKGQTEGIEVVGTIASPNLEKILALKPDLILSSKIRDEERYDLLSEIAPTVFAERLGDAWLDNFTLFAEALGKQQEGEAIVAAYKQRLADLHDKLSAAGEVPTVSMVRFTQSGQTRIYHTGSFIGSILAEGQFPRPASQQLTDEVWTENSKELIGDLDGDVIFYGVYGKAEDSPLAEYTNDPLWKQLDAVKNERVFQVTDDYWYTSIGTMAANLVIDDLEGFLLPNAESAAAAEALPASASGPIVVKDSKGIVTLEARPTRIVACTEEAIDFLITLEVQPIGICSTRISGATSGAPYQLPHFFPKEMIGTPTFVGSADSPSLEHIALLQPDLIISGVWSEEANNQMAQIAPLFTVDTDAPGYWSETLLELGKALGREAEAQRFLAGYDASAKRLAEQLAPVAARTPNVLFIYSYAATDGTMILGPKWTGSKPFEQLGFNVLEPAGVDLTNGGVAPTSPEIVGQVKADIIFVIRVKTEDNQVPRYPIDTLLDSLNGPRVIYQTIDSTRGSTAPYTDQFVLKEIAGLLAE